MPTAIDSPIPEGIPRTLLPQRRFGASHRGALLLVGAVLLFASQMRAGVGILAWIAPVPWLRYLRLAGGWRSRMLFGLVVIGAWTATTLKIVTAPLPVAFALLGVGIGAFPLAGYLLWDLARRRMSDRRATLFFAASMVIVEWLQSATPLSTWGAAVYTQVDNLPFLQVASIVGGGGVGFFVNWVAASLEADWAARVVGDDLSSERPSRLAWTALAAVALLHAWGTWRLERPLGTSSTPVAAVDTTATFGASPELPDAAERARIIDSLLSDSRRAAAAGARVVVWTEAAALALPSEEEALVRHAAATAAEARVHLVAAYIVPTRLKPLTYENKLVWITPQGTVDHEYLKHHPVPGEPAVVGTSAARFLSTDFGRASVAICYDYDFPAIAFGHGRLAVDFVALPASDWRGIDPLHTQMAAVRAIENGLSILRSTRFGLSAAIDPHGRIRAWRSSFDGADRVMQASLPRDRVSTLHAAIGEMPIVAFAFCLLLALRFLRRPSSRALSQSIQR